MLLEKILIHIAAAQLAGSVTQNLPDTLTLDATVKAQDLQAQNLMTWELHRIFLHGITGALSEPSWPDPKPDATALSTDNIPNLLNTVTSVLAGPQGAALLGLLRGVVSGAAASSATAAPTTLPTAAPKPGGGGP